jgi:nicotinamidase-related amidase
MKILIVVDMQNDFIDGALGTKEAVAIVPSVLKKIKEFQGKVIFTLDTHPEDYMNTQEGKNLPVRHCIRGTDGWKLPEEIDRLRSEKNADVYEKPTFGSKELASDLEKLNKTEKIESIELIGLCTDICVVSNALMIKAFLPEVEISVDESCMAGVTPEKHEAALETMRSCQIKVC